MAYVLCFKAGLGIQGLWYGHMCGLGAVIVFYQITLSWKINWQDQADLAAARDRE
jgi:hypothetical protein